MVLDVAQVAAEAARAAAAGAQEGARASARRSPRLRAARAPGPDGDARAGKGEHANAAGKRRRAASPAATPPRRLRPSHAALAAESPSRRPSASTHPPAKRQRRLESSALPTSVVTRSLHSAWLNAQNQPAKLSFLALPPEVITLVLRHLCAADLVNASMACHALHDPVPATMPHQNNKNTNMTLPSLSDAAALANVEQAAATLSAAVSNDRTESLNELMPASIARRALQCALAEARPAPVPAAAAQGSSGGAVAHQGVPHPAAVDLYGTATARADGPSSSDALSTPSAPCTPPWKRLMRWYTELGKPELVATAPLCNEVWFKEETRFQQDWPARMVEPAAEGVRTDQGVAPPPPPPPPTAAAGAADDTTAPRPTTRPGQMVDVWRWEIKEFSKLVAHAAPAPAGDADQSLAHADNDVATTRSRTTRSRARADSADAAGASAAPPPTTPGRHPPDFKEPSRTLLFPKKLENEKGFVYSAPFVSGGAPWRIMLFPHGNSVEYLSVYVDLADAQVLSSIRDHGGRQGAVFQFTIVNQDRRAESMSKAADHRFDRREDDWGFTQFMPLEVLRDPARGFIVNDTVLLELRLAVCRTIEPSVRPPG